MSLRRSERMTSADAFTHVMKHGRKAGGRAFVVYVSDDTLGKSDGYPLVGLIVSKAIGNAVQRNLMKRRLRSIVASSDVTGSMCWVIRALPGSKTMTYDALESTLIAAMSNALRKWRKHQVGATS